MAGQEAAPDDVTKWDLLNIEVDGKLRLAARFCGDLLRLILFRPGDWEQWFGTHEPTDREEMLP